MKTNKNYLALTFLLAGLQLAQADATSTSSSNKPEQIALMRANYVDYDKTSRKTDNLQSLIAQSKDGVTVTTAPQATAQMFSEVLPGNVVYMRVASFTPATSWEDMAAQVNNADAVSSPGLVIDLRNNTTPDDFNGALQVANFVSEGQSGLVVRDGAVATGAPVTVSLHSHPTIVVLTNRQTRGAAEALAACLKAHGALVMGEATEGKAAVVPDVSTPANEQDENSALALIDQKQVTEVIGEADSRHRMSEAALVQGQDPEQDEFLASHEKSAPLPLVRSLPVTRDVALVEAIDSLKAIRVLQGQEISASTTVAVR